MNTLKLNSVGLNRVTLNTIGEVRFVSKPPIPTYTLSASVVNGVVSATLNGVAVPLPYTAKEGDVIVVSVTPTDGYTFEGWSDGNTDNPRTITMSEDVDLSAECVEDVPSYENGVYIQHIDGKLYTTEEWTAKAFANEVANGVAVVADECRFVVAKEYAQTGGSWASEYNTLIEGVFTTTSKAEALTDFNGLANYALIPKKNNNGAAYKISKYRFPNGAEGYMPSAGEMGVLHNNINEIKAALSQIGGVSLGSYLWTSTQADASQAWQYRPSNILQAVSKTYSTSCIAFTELK